MMQSLLKTYFLEQVVQAPDNTCLEVGNTAYSYFQVNVLVQEIADSLIALNIHHKAIMVLNEHTVFSYASILAIQFTGNAFLPIDISWPAKRIEDILNAVKPAAIVASSKELLEDGLKNVPALRNLLLIEPGNLKDYREIISFDKAADYPDIAYILFTSGSTGLPKGVPVSTRNLNAYIRHHKSYYYFSPNDRFLQVYELTFDVAYFSFFIPLCFGACCCILNQKKGVPKYLNIINDLLHRHITVVSMVPTIINLSGKYIKNRSVATVRHCFFIGDALYHSDASLWQEFVPQAQIHNYYGPTEATIACSDYLWKPLHQNIEQYNDIVSIGKLFSGLQFKIVDEDMSDVPQGKIGELLLSGAQVVDGYVNKVHQEQFITFSTDNNQYITYYKTGDLVSLTESGNLMFHGRVDHQVKFNGYRIELSEIQLAINKLTGRKVVVTKKKKKDGFYCLSAVVEGNTLSVPDLREGLRNVLPEYMIPAEVSFMPQLPLTANGKIDIRSLQNI